jgi:hypothetical protein
VNKFEKRPIIMGEKDESDHAENEANTGRGSSSRRPLTHLQATVHAINFIK